MASLSIAENLIKPFAKDLVESKIGKTYVRNIESVPLSNSTVFRRISDLSEYCQKEVIWRVKQSPTFSLQMDKSIEITGLAILLVFVCCIYNSTIEVDLLLCKSLETHTRGKGIFLLVDSYFEEHEMS